MNQNALFETTPVRKAYRTLVIPLVMSNLVTLIYNLVDTYFIAQTGITDLIAGVSVCGPIFYLFPAFGDLFAMGGSTLVSRLFGEKRDSDGTGVSAFCFYIAICIGVLFAAMVLLFKAPFLQFLGTTSETYTYASQYLTIIAMGSPLIILMYIPSNMIRTEGFAKHVMIASVSGSVINIILDPIFISTLGMGASGAAIATVLGYIFNVSYLILFILTRKLRISINPRKIRLPKGALAEMLKIGIPASILNIFNWLSQTITYRFLAPYGSNASAAMGIALKISLIATMIMIGMSFGPQPLIGFNYGAKNYKRLKETLNFCIKMNVIVAAIIGAVLIIFAPQIMWLFTKDPVLIDMGSVMLRILEIGVVCSGVCWIMNTIFQSCGKGSSALIISVGKQGVIFTLTIFIASCLFAYNGVIWAQAITDIISCILAVIIYKKGLGREIKEHINMHCDAKKASDHTSGKIPSELSEEIVLETGKCPVCGNSVNESDSVCSECGFPMISLVPNTGSEDIERIKDMIREYRSKIKK